MPKADHKNTTPQRKRDLFRAPFRSLEGLIAHFNNPDGELPPDIAAKEVPLFGNEKSAMTRRMRRAGNMSYRYGGSKPEIAPRTMDLRACDADGVLRIWEHDKQVMPLGNLWGDCSSSTPFQAGRYVINYHGEMIVVRLSAEGTAYFRVQFMVDDTPGILLHWWDLEEMLLGRVVEPPEKPKAAFDAGLQALFRRLLDRGDDL